MKFKFLLWLISKRMIRAGKKNVNFKKAASGKNGVIQMSTRDGNTIRHFIFKNGQISSFPFEHEKPACKVIFKDTGYGFSALLPWNKRMQVAGMQSGDIKVEGDFSFFLWFQNLGNILQSGKK